jgi:hypothetical protein
VPKSITYPKKVRATSAASRCAICHRIRKRQPAQFVNVQHFEVAHTVIASLKESTPKRLVEWLYGGTLQTGTGTRIHFLIDCSEPQLN